MGRLYLALLGSALSLGASLAHACLTTDTSCTIVGTDFTLNYNPSALGAFGSLTLVGDTLEFTPNNFSVTSLNGAQVQQIDQTVNLTLTANGSFRFGALSLAEFGDYQMQGPNSYVAVSGQLRAFDTANSFTTQTAGNITSNPALPLTINDNANHNWAANAGIDNTTQTVLGGGAGWLANAATVNVTIEDILQAYTQACPGGCTQPESAFIQKKFDGVGVALTVTPVPLGPTGWLLLSGLGALAGFGAAPRRAAWRETLTAA